MIGKFWSKIRRTSRRTYIVTAAFLVAASLAVTGWYFYNQHQLYSRIDTGATLVTADLHTTSLKLRDTFGLTSDKFHSKENTATYLNLLTKMQADCKKIDVYNTEAKQSNTSDSLRQYLAKSNEMCTELVKLAKDGVTLTEAVRPVMNLNSRVKRYETLPFIADGVRSRYEKTVNETSDQLTDKIRFVEYQSQSILYLQQLQAAIKANKGLDFFPVLATTQQNLYGERQRYWNSDVDLGNLINAMRVMQGRYCDNLPRSGPHLSVCKQKSSD